MSRIAVIGTGYVGLTTGAYLAHIGHQVVCADVVADKVDRLSRGEIPIFETGLEELVRSGLESGNLRFVLGSAEAVTGAEFVFLCLPTPQGEDGAADLSYVQAEAERLGPILDPGSIVINKSTVPVGSTRMVERTLARGDVFVVSNPEFLREGTAVHDSLHPDRIVIGADDAAAASRVAGLYARLRAPVLVTDPASAELIKYASNAFLATKVSYINAIANLCEVVGADVKEVVLGMGYDKRIGFEFLRPGPGWGGSCFHPDETLLVRREDSVRMLSFDRLFAEVELTGADGWEALSWDPSGIGPEFMSVAAFTSRPYEGDLVSLRTKMGRRLLVTPDHPMVVAANGDPATRRVVAAGDLTREDWLPVAEGFPAPRWEEAWGLPLGALDAAGLIPEQVIIRAGTQLTSLLEIRRNEIHWSRRRDILRSCALRLSELDALDIDLRPEADLPAFDAWAGTTTNGTYIPLVIPMDGDFWRMIGLYLSEGAITNDGARARIGWFFHPTREVDLVDFVCRFWARLGVKTSVTTPPTSMVVKVSSRILAAWFEHSLGLGRSSNDKALPEEIWTRPDEDRRLLLRGLWDGDGSWSYVNGGPSVVFEYGTTSRALADGMLRLLSSLGVCARLKIGRTAKSKSDAYWLTIAGADQVEDCLWLFPENEQDEIRRSIERQTKRTAPTGYRRTKNAAWVRVATTELTPYEGMVYSLEVPGTHTVVATHGLVAHNCFPKDSRALVRIAEDAGYSFSLLEGVIDVNVEQYDRIATKIAHACPDGVVEGRTIAVWGLTFKALTDDLRDSPALEVIKRLQARGATVRAFDPMVDPARGASQPALATVDISPDPYGACAGADLVAVLTEWDEFRWLDFDKVKSELSNPVVVDCRNLLDPAAMRRRGFTYVGVGRP